MNNLVYLMYGPDGQIDELVYSVLSALYMLGSEISNYRIILYTDDPDAFGHLPVQIEPVNSKLLTDWAGPFNFNHRRKIFVIRHALEKFGGRVLYCDSDSYFLKHPNEVFSRIRPGRTLMHLCEGHLNDSNGAGLREFLDSSKLHTVTRKRWNITSDALMFNAGVIGMHETDIGLLEEVVYLTDQIYPYVRIHTIEQFAFSACLSQRTKLQVACDVICHYWRMPGRAVFREQLRRVLHDPSVPVDEERFRRLLPLRPSQQNLNFSRSLKERIRSTLRGVAKRVGILNMVGYRSRRNAAG